MAVGRGCMHALCPHPGGDDFFRLGSATGGVQKNSEMLSETKRKRERKARFNLVRSTNSPIQPNTTRAQCARCVFSESLAHAMFVLAVLSHHQITFQIQKWFRIEVCIITTI